MFMDYIKNFNYSAILLIYPDGTVDYELIDHRLLHLEYYIDLNKKSAKLNEVIMTNQIDIPESINDTENGFTWQIDTDLAMNGVIAFHNLFITEIYSDRGYAEDMPSTFYVSLPSKLGQVNFPKPVRPKERADAKNFASFEKC